MCFGYDKLKPIAKLIYGYLGILMIGFLLLCIPLFHELPIAVIDHLFIATSALSTTGLSSVDIGTTYNWGGQLLILLLIQIGGLGYMSIGSFIVLMRRKHLSSENAALVQYDFSLPDDFNIPTFIRDLVIFSLLIETVGAVLLMLIFLNAGEDQAIWNGIFHSISAFCTAGFSLYPNNFESYASNFYLNAVIGALSICGALGFIVFTDLLERIRNRKQQITFTSKIIIRFTSLGIFLGTAILFLGNSFIGDATPEERLLTSFFQSMAAFTTVGFNTYAIDNLVPSSLFLLLLLMVMGASPSGTGGGVKSTTITALYAQMISTLRGDKNVIYMNRIIPAHRVSMAASNFFFYVIIICLGTYLLLSLEQDDTFVILFEAVSALGTVGLSLGLTANLSDLGKLIIIVMMFLGRIGPLSLGTVLFNAAKKEQEIVKEDVAI